MRNLLKRIAGHFVDRTDRREVLPRSEMWHPERSLDDYFIDMRPKLLSVPMLSDEELAKLRAGTTVPLCQLAIAFYQRYRREADDHDLQDFLTCADLLIETQEQSGLYQGGWMHVISSPYRSKRPWISAMAQGEALSVLLRARAVSEEGDRYEKAARLAADPFFRTLEQGGVVSHDVAGLVYLEEYPFDPPSHVLNGWIFAWMGLREYADVLEDKKAASLASESLTSLVASLPRYDTGYWSRYDLFPQFPMAFLANRFYQRLHIAQLRAMFDLTEEPTFREYADRWNRYMDNRTCRTRYAWHRLLFKGACVLTGW